MFDSIKTELRDVLVMPFGMNRNLDTFTAEGATVPDEVPVLRPDGMKAVGRATLRIKDDGIYADIAIVQGTVDGLKASANVIVHSFDITATEGKQSRKIRRYEVTSVGLTAVPTEKATVTDETPVSDKEPESQA